MFHIDCMQPRKSSAIEQLHVMTSKLVGPYTHYSSIQ